MHLPNRILELRHTIAQVENSYNVIVPDDISTKLVNYEQKAKDLAAIEAQVAAWCNSIINVQV